jgi:hypothetical protein
VAFRLGFFQIVLASALNYLKAMIPIVLKDLLQVEFARLAVIESQEMCPEGGL